MSEEMDINTLLPAKYLQFKKQQYYERCDMNEGDNAGIDQKWCALSNQIKSGQMLGLKNSDMELYTEIEDYCKREFIKSCIYEGVPQEVLAKIISMNAINDMLAVKIDYYRAENVLKNVQGTVNTIRAAVGDCEEKFGIFEKYLDTFETQIKIKNDEITELQQKYNSVMDELRNANQYITELKVNLVQAETKLANDPEHEKSYIINRIVEVDAEETDEYDEADRDDTNVFHKIKNMLRLPPLKKVSDDAYDDIDDKEKSKPKKYTKKAVKVEHAMLST